MIRTFLRIAICIALGLVSVVATQATSVAAASADTIGDYEVNGVILAKYNAVGGEAVVGEPTSEQYATAPRTGLNGIWQEFENGKIFSSSEAGTHWVPNGPLLDAYWEVCPFFCHGLPTSDVINGWKGSKILRMQFGGDFYWSASTGVHTVSGAALDKYASLGSHRGTRGFLGLPTSDTVPTVDGVGEISRFQWGVIVWTPETGAHEVHGGIRWKWSSLGGGAGSLGYPISDEHSVPGGRQSDFENGSIFWNSQTGQLTVTYK